MIVDLPLPHKALWPNGRAHWSTKAREVKKHRSWAFMACPATSGLCVAGKAIRVHLTVHPHPRGPLPDSDNASAACKAYLDGIADRLGINDKAFAAPVVEFASERTGRFILTIGD